VKNVERADKISLFRVPAAQTLKFLSLPVFPLSMGTAGTPLTDLIRADSAVGWTKRSVSTLSEVCPPSVASAQLNFQAGKFIPRC